MAKQNNECWERIEKVLKHAGMSTNYFAEYIGLPRGENLYQIKRGNNRISLDVAQKIHEKFPKFSIPWLMFGDLGIVDMGDIDVVRILPLHRDIWNMPLPPEKSSAEQFIISSAAANGAEFAVQLNGDPMTTPFYLRDAILLFRQKRLEEVGTGSGLYLIEQEETRLFKFLERKAYMDGILMVDIVPDYQASEVVNDEEIISLWQVCATVKKW